MDKWLNCPVNGFLSWPKNQKEVKYNSYELVLLPLNDQYDPSLHLKMTSLSDIEAMTIVNRFISVLSWKNGKSVQQITEGDITSTIHPFSKKSDFRYISCQDPYPDIINGPIDLKEQLALSLYREGLSLNSIPYRFLSLFKIINIKYKDKYEHGKHELKEWISQNTSNLLSPQAQKRIDEITTTGNGLTDYLYTSCRCAIAHAYASPVVDPDDIQDLRRLQSDLVLITGLAELLIEKEMGISRSLWD